MHTICTLTIEQASYVFDKTRDYGKTIAKQWQYVNFSLAYPFSIHSHFLTCVCVCVCHHTFFTLFFCIRARFLFRSVCSLCFHMYACTLLHFPSSPFFFGSFILTSPGLSHSFFPVFYSHFYSCSFPLSFVLFVGKFSLFVRCDCLWWNFYWRISCYCYYYYYYY